MAASFGGVVSFVFNAIVCLVRVREPRVDD